MSKYERDEPNDKDKEKAEKEKAEKAEKRLPPDPGVPTGPGITEPDPNDPGKGYRPLPGPDLTPPAPPAPPAAPAAPADKK